MSYEPVIIVRGNTRWQGVRDISHGDVCRLGSQADDLNEHAHRVAHKLNRGDVMWLNWTSESTYDESQLPTVPDINYAPIGDRLRAATISLDDLSAGAQRISGVLGRFTYEIQVSEDLSNTRTIHVGSPN